MIGNDLVDLQLAARESNWRRKSFFEKVFTPSEQEFIRSRKEADVHVWLLWSMKEAAYKAHQRKFSLPRKLNWKAQECRVQKISGREAVGIVTIGDQEYYTLSRFFKAAIHSVASDVEEPLISMEVLDVFPHRLKEILLQKISVEGNLSIVDLKVVKDKNGIPQISYRRKKPVKHSMAKRGAPVSPYENLILPLEFSLSHHGRFAAYCLRNTLKDTPLRKSQTFVKHS